MWKGRQAPWFVAEGYEELMAEIRSASSQRLVQVFEGSPEEKLTKLLAMQARLRSNLCEFYKEKLSFCFELPWFAIGAFWGCIGGCARRSRDTPQAQNVYLRVSLPARLPADTRVGF